MTKRIVASFVFFTLAGTATATLAQGKGSNPNGKPFIELQGQIVEIEGEVSTLADQVESLVGRVDSLESDQAATNAAIASLQEQNAILQDQIDANAEGVESLEAELAALLEENQLLQAQVDANRGNIRAAQEQINTNSGLISSLQQSLSQLGTSLQDQIDNNEQLISAMQSRIAALETAMTMKQNAISGRCPTGEAIRVVLSNGTVVCEPTESGSGYLRVAYAWNSVSLAGGSSGCASADCPDGYIPIGVGKSTYSMDTREAYVDSRGGSVACFANTSPYPQAGRVEAICLYRETL